MSKVGWVLRTICLPVMVAACSELDTRYFKDRVNEVTMEQVARRYGAPHKSERIANNGTVWTYFERGSGTASFSGFATGGMCHVYLLTFDQQDVLREWKEHECQK
jgi:hypothetical protein